MKLLSLCLVALFGAACGALAGDPLAWSPPTREVRPWTYWWWMGSAVDPANLTRELERFRDAGLGGVHIIPIYGAKGAESRFIDHLSPRWMEMLRHTVTEARRICLDVDMTTGSGWCFGGPQVTAREANALAVMKTFDVPEGAKLVEKFERAATHTLMAFPPQGAPVELTARIGADGVVDWIAPGAGWRVFAVSQKPSPQKVKRAGPGGAGPMLNLLSPPAMQVFLRPFTDAFAAYDGPKPRAMYHDSYEYKSDWSPEFLAQFEQRRGYRLQDKLPALFGNDESDHVARVKGDYRETASDILIEESLPAWVGWARAHGFLTRNEAHGSPGNLLDLYALADIPETEMFHTDRNRLVSKLASSAAHVAGRPLTSAETGTWLSEHFTETAGEMKTLLDDLFLSGVNHVFFHGTCYSPDDAPWPGWVFYASTQMNPRNALWNELPALATYIARCQAELRAGRPDNDLLLYWPIHDVWHNAREMLPGLTVHARGWMEEQPFGQAAELLWNRGFGFDYVSDRQLALAAVEAGAVTTGGSAWRAVVVPSVAHLPLPTFEKLLALAESGATIIFEALPQDVPGLAKLEERRAALQEALKRVRLADSALDGVREARLGQGRVFVGALDAALAAAKIERERLVDHGLLFLRRATADGHAYFVANRSAQAVDGWIPLAVAAESVAVLDPQSGRTGVGAVQRDAAGRTTVRLQLPPGASLLLRTFASRKLDGPAWPVWTPQGEPIDVYGEWRVRFADGGPEFPAPAKLTQLASWTEFAGEPGQRFAGTARYTLTFDAPAGAGPWLLDLGLVADSARVRVNGRDLGPLLLPPFRVALEALQPQGNTLEVDVTNTSANRLRDLDRRGVKWQNFYDINFVNIGYQPFNAATWPLRDAGLLGPVRLLPLR